MTISIHSRKLATGPEDVAEHDADHAKSRLHAGSTHLMRGGHTPVAFGSKTGKSRSEQMLSPHTIAETRSLLVMAAPPIS
jgi:hypothetical protein